MVWLPYIGYIYILNICVSAYNISTRIAKDIKYIYMYNRTDRSDQGTDRWAARHVDTTMDSHLVKVRSVDVWIQHWSSWFFLSQIQDEQINNDNSTWVFLPGSQGVTWKVVEFLEFFLCLSGVLEIWDCTCAGTYFEEEASATMHFRPLDRICVKSFFFHFFFRPLFCFFCPNQLPIYQWFKGWVHHMM